MIKTASSIIREYGLKWTINRTLYDAKLKMMRLVPVTDKIFEKKVSVEKIDLFDFNVVEIELFLSELSENEKDKIVSLADNAILGKIKVFSSQELDYGNPIQWNYNPLTKEYHDFDLKWYKIADFDSRVGDVKVIWEASRLTHFLHFARAYMITKDVKYFRAFSDQLDSWLEKNKYSFGPNYKCGQEATIRMINVLMSYSIFNKYDITDSNLNNKVKYLVESSYKRVLSNFFYAHKCIKNNHTFTEILGRIIGSWCSEDDDETKYSMDLMDKEIVKQFTLDGGFTQYSYNYHRFTLQIFEVLFSVQSKIKHEISEGERLNKSVLLLYNLMNADGFLPNYGSNDGALIFPLSNSDYRDYRPTLNTVYAQINGKKLFETDIYSEELLWFYKDVETAEAVEKKSLNLTEIGTYSFLDKNSIALIHLNNFKTRPAHMDQLHFELWYKDIDIFTDQGTFSYASELGAQLSTNEEHNTVYIKDKPLMNKKGAFMVYDWSKIEEISFDGNHFIGKLRSRNGYTHQRDVLKTKTGFEINDLIEGVDTGFSVNFHTPLEVKVIDNKAILSKDGKDLVELISDNSIVVEKTYRSLYYLEKEVINKLSIKIGKGNTTKTIINLVEGE